MLTIRFSALSDPADPLVYRVHLDSQAVGQTSGAFRLPFDVAMRRTLQHALAPGFQLEQAPPTMRQTLQPFGALERLHATVGEALAQALLADPVVRTSFERALGLAESQ